MKCIKCNSQVDFGAAFCSTCGAKIENTKTKNVNNSDKEPSVELIIANAMKIPGVKVNRKEFLAKTFANEDVKIDEIIELGPVAAGCSKKKLRRIANRIVLTRTSESSIISFIAGIPGGLAMAAAIPADVLQFFGMTLRLAQEISYIYGLEDLWKNEEVDYEKIQNQLIMYCGVMFGVSGAAQGVRLLATQLAKQTLKQLPKQALTKTVWYPVVKQIGKAIGIKITKDIAAQGISKAIPVIGGLISGGITFASMNPMGKRLIDVLEEANFTYTDAKAEKDLKEIENIADAKIEELDVDLDLMDEEIIIDEDESDLPLIENLPQNNSSNEDIFGTLEKLADLKNKGIITEEEFSAKKAELLSRI